MPNDRNGIDVLRASPGGLPKFTVLDGTLHFQRGLEKSRFSEDPVREDNIANDLQKAFLELVSTLRAPVLDGAKGAEDGPASTHYAMLEMDGDGMGRVFSKDRSTAERGSRALLVFAAAVPFVVSLHGHVADIGGHL